MPNAENIHPLHRNLLAFAGIAFKNARAIGTMEPSNGSADCIGVDDLRNLIGEGFAEFGIADALLHAHGFGNDCAAKGEASRPGLDGSAMGESRAFFLRARNGNASCAG